MPTLEALGDLYTKSGRYADGLEVDLLLTSRDPHNATYMYNLACSFCRLNDPDKSIDSLKKAIELGYEDYEWMAKDDDLESIRNHPEFIRLIEKQKSP